MLLAVAAPVATRAQQAAIPTPESSFGFPVGADYKLFGYDQSIAYFRKLAAASNRIRLIEVGKTSTGHPWTAALISSPENLDQLDHFREINMRLAHPDGLTDAEAKLLARRGACLRRHQRRAPRIGDRRLAAHAAARVRDPLAGRTSRR